jgi:hypothetical protein
MTFKGLRIAAGALAFCAVAAATTLPAAAAAPKAKARKVAAAAKPRLTAEQVLDKYLIASGGRAAYENMKTMVTTASLELVEPGLRGTMILSQRSPDKLLVTTTIDQIGEARQGFDGKVGWSKDKLQGLRTLEGLELSRFRMSANTDLFMRWRSFFREVSLQGTRKVGDRTAHVVRMLPQEGDALVGYFDTKTFLPVRMDGTFQGPQGEIPIVTHLSDYRTAGGIKVPYLMRQRVGDAMTMVIKISDVKVNAPVDDAIFAKPAS